ncbi:hypothetical protein C8J56DRAFT_936717 [Mycena floridula]|nr:hypothetical protein C8J56DRAFT_936717 [Mycena floridula]
MGHSPPALRSLKSILSYFDTPQRQLSDEQNNVAAQLRSLQFRILDLQRRRRHSDFDFDFDFEDCPELDLELETLALQLYSAELNIVGGMLEPLEWPFSPEEAKGIVAMCERFKAKFILGNDFEVETYENCPVIELPRATEERKEANSTEPRGAVVNILRNNIISEINGPVRIYIKISLNYHFLGDRPHDQPFDGSNTTLNMFSYNSFKNARAFVFYDEILTEDTCEPVGGLAAEISSFAGRDGPGRYFSGSILAGDICEAKFTCETQAMESFASFSGCSSLHSANSVQTFQ